MLGPGILLSLVAWGLDPGADDDFERVMVPFVQSYCMDCHSSPEAEADLDLAAEVGRGPGDRTVSVWRAVRRKLVTEEMPPEGYEAPPATERLHVVRTLKLLFGEPELAVPAAVTMRRLNRVEYENTIRDLLGIEFHARENFPADDVGHGFDNIGDVLSLSPILLEKYLTAAEDIARRAIVVGDGQSIVRRVSAGELSSERGGERNGWHYMSSGGEAHAKHTFPRDGVYVLRARMYGQQAGPEAVQAGFTLDGRVVREVEVAAVREAPGVYEWKLSVQQGSRRVGVDFLNDYYMPEHPDPSQRDRNMALEFLEIEGPLDVSIWPASHRRWIEVDGKKRRLDLSRVFTLMMRRAYRRPPARADVERLHDVVENSLPQGASFEEKVRLGLTAILVSPRFLFRIEQDPSADQEVRDLDAHELASRLSYFLWSSMPDDELLELADRVRLLQSDVLERQVRRMLQDPRATALAENFALQWLKIRPLEEITPDRDQFPDVGRDLLESMQAETLLLFDAVLREGRPVWTLLDSEFTFVNEPLARHYGMPGVHGSWMRRVAVPDERRGGVLTHASVLTVTSNPTRTSPVKRGKWLLSTIMNAPIPAPPPGLDNLDEGEEASRLTMRERIAMHRARPECAVCHDQMDPLGLALEHYDPVGRWRALDGFHPVDASARFPDGREFEGLPGLLQVVRSDDAFLHSLARHLFTYALGRGLNPADDAAVVRLVAELRHKPTLPDLILAIVEEQAFRQARRPVASDPGEAR